MKVRGTRGIGEAPVLTSGGADDIISEAKIRKMKMEEQSQFLKLPQVAKILNVAYITVYRLLKSGAFKGAFKVGQGKAWRIPKSSVYELIEEWKKKR